MGLGSLRLAQESLSVDGARKWRHAALAVVIAGVGALALIAGAGAPSVQADAGPAAASPTTLAALVAKAQAQVIELSAQVQTAREQIARDQAQSRQERHQLADLVAQEYTGAPNGLLSVLASPDFNTALDTQIELDQLTQSQRQLLRELGQAVRNQQATESQLQQELQQEATTEARLRAEELVAQFRAEAVVSAPRVQGGPSPASSPTPSPTAPASTTPAPPTPTASAPTPNPTPAPSGAGPFTTNTNLALASGISLQQVQEFLQGTPLEGDAGYFIGAEQTVHVSAVYLVADAVLETGWGTSALYTNKHNLFGFHAYDANPYVDGATFTSDQDCISYVSWFVSVYYLTPPGSQVPSYGGLAGTVATGQYYHGPTLAGMNIDYASDPQWAAKIAKIGSVLQSMPA